MRVVTVLRRWTPGLGGSALAWSFVLSVVTQASTFTMSFALARIIGRTEFGEWAAIQNTVGTLSGIAQVSMSVTATKFVAELKLTDPGRVGRILGLCSAVTLATGLAVALSVFFSAHWFSASVLHAPQLANALRISAVSLLLLTVNGYQTGALAGLERFRALAILGLVQGMSIAVLVLLLAWLWGRDGAVAGFAAAALVSFVISRRVLRTEAAAFGVRVVYGRLGRELSMLAHFALPATLAGLAGMLAAWLSTLVLVRSPAGYWEMASLSAAQAMRGAVLFAPAVITRVSAPVLARHIGGGALDRHRESLRASTILAFAVAALVAALVALAAPALLALFGKSFRASTGVVVVMAASGVLEAGGNALNQQFLSRSRMWWNLFMVIGRGAILVVATALLVPAHGALGAGWAVLIAYGAAVAFVLAFSATTGARPGPRLDRTVEVTCRSGTAPDS